MTGCGQCPLLAKSQPAPASADSPQRSGQLAPASQSLPASRSQPQASWCESGVPGATTLPCAGGVPSCVCTPLTGRPRNKATKHNRKSQQQSAAAKLKPQSNRRIIGKKPKSEHGHTRNRKYTTINIYDSICRYCTDVHVVHNRECQGPRSGTPDTHHHIR